MFLNRRKNEILCRKNRTFVQGQAKVLSVLKSMVSYRVVYFFQVVLGRGCIENFIALCSVSFASRGCCDEER